MTDAETDICEWQSGLPCVAEWNVKGFPLTWHAQQLKAGHRFLPSIFLPQSDEAGYSASFDRYMSGAADALRYLAQVASPICLRMGNIGQALYDLPCYRVPLKPENISRSPLVWTQNDEVYNDQRQTDSLASAGLWGVEGSVLGSTEYVRRLTEELPCPAWISLIENNEAAYDKPEWYFADANAAALAYKSPESIKRLSVRAAQTCPDYAPEDLIAEMAERRAEQYAAFYAGFERELSPTWRGRTKTACYYKPDLRYPLTTRGDIKRIGYFPELLRADGASIDNYVSLNQAHDFTSPDHLKISNMIPAWARQQQKNPRAYRELSLTLGSKAAIQGAIEGRHAPITPDLFGCYVQWLLWTIRDGGVPVILRHWCGASTRPTDPFFADDIRGQYPAFTSDATVEDYILPIMTAVDRICDTPDLRTFWRYGESITIANGVLPTNSLRRAAGLPPYPNATDVNIRRRHLVCDANGPESEWKWDAGRQRFGGTVRVWAVATKFGDDYLLYAWTPCKLDGKVTIEIPDCGTVQIDAPKPSGYWLLSAVNSVNTKRLM